MAPEPGAGGARPKGCAPSMFQAGASRYLHPQEQRNLDAISPESSRAPFLCLQGMRFPRAARLGSRTLGTALALGTVRVSHGPFPGSGREEGEEAPVLPVGGSFRF